MPRLTLQDVLSPLSTKKQKHDSGSEKQRIYFEKYYVNIILTVACCFQVEIEITLSRTVNQELSTIMADTKIESVQTFGRKVIIIVLFSS